MLANSVGIIDPNYRGTIKVRFRGPTKLERELDGAKVYYKGDKIAQLVLLPYAVFPMEVAELSETERSAGGFGSTGA
jgi:dUTPase